jgi:hypothetical protein
MFRCQSRLIASTPEFIIGVRIGVEQSMIGVLPLFIPFRQFAFLCRSRRSVTIASLSVALFRESHSSLVPHFRVSRAACFTAVCHFQQSVSLRLSKSSATLYHCLFGCRLLLTVTLESGSRLSSVEAGACSACSSLSSIVILPLLKPSSIQITRS